MLGRGLCLVLPIMLNYVPKTNAGVSCKAGTFAMGGPGSVTCDFGKNIRKQQHNFNVVQYGLQSPNTANYLLLCNWVSSEPECTVKDGLTFALNPDDTGLTINITSVDATMAGKVVCQLVPDDGLQTTPCDIAIILGCSYVSDTKGNVAITQAFDSSESNNYGVLIGILIFFAVLLLVFGCAAIALLIFTRLRYKIVTRDKLGDGKMSRGWGDICVCRLFQAVLVRFHVCLNIVDEEAATKEMFTSTFIEVVSKEVQCTKIPVADTTTNTENEGVHVTVTLHPKDSNTTPYPILDVVTNMVAEGLITANSKEQGKNPAADRPIEKNRKQGKRDCDTSTIRSEIPVPAPQDHGKEFISNSPLQNTDKETCTEPQRIESANSVEAMRLKVYDSEPTRRPGTMTENADHDENNKSATFEDNERLIFKVEDDMDTDQARALLTSDQPDSSDANESCQVDELSPMDSEENGDRQGLSRKKRWTESLRKKLKLK